MAVTQDGVVWRHRQTSRHHDDESQESVTQDAEVWRHRQESRHPLTVEDVMAVAGDH